jgi:hypothetical protein
MKLKCNKVGRGWHPPPGYEDKLSLNRWAQALKPVVPGRI